MTSKYEGKHLLVAREPKYMMPHRRKHWLEITSLFRSTGRRYHPYEEVVAKVTAENPDKFVRQMINAGFLGVFR